VRFTLLILLSFSFLTSKSQNLELIQNQWEAIAKAKTAEEKLMRNCRMGALGIGSNFDFEMRTIKRETDLNVIEGISDLMDDSSRIRLISRFFEIENGKYQYDHDYACAFKTDSTYGKNKSMYGLMFGRRACDNDHELSCKPCQVKSYIEDDWEGAYYTDLTTFYQDSLMYLKLEGAQYHANGTVPVMHTFTVSPSCKIKFLDESQ